MCFVFPADVVVLPGPSCDTPVTGVAGQELEQMLGEVAGALGWGRDGGWVGVFPALRTSQKISLYRLFLIRGVIGLNNTWTNVDSVMQ